MVVTALEITKHNEGTVVVEMSTTFSKFVRK